MKFYKFATWESLLLGGNVRSGIENVGLSSIVLMSSLGFMQQTIERVQTWTITTRRSVGQLTGAWESNAIERRLPDTAIEQCRQSLSRGEGVNEF